MNVRTSFRGAKLCIFFFKGSVFVIFTNLGKDMMEKLGKQHTKTRN